MAKMSRSRYIKAGIVAALLFSALTIAFFKSGIFSINGYSSPGISLVPAELNAGQAEEEKEIDDDGSTDYFSIFRLINGLIPDQKQN
jgi:hypothetical protein